MAKSVWQSGPTSTRLATRGDPGNLSGAVGWATWVATPGVFSSVASSSLLPKNKFREFDGPDKTIPRDSRHHREGIDASKGKGKTFSSFDIDGPLTELIQLANLAGIVGEAFPYDLRSRDW